MRAIIDAPMLCPLSLMGGGSQENLYNVKSKCSYLIIYVGNVSSCIISPILIFSFSHFSASAVSTDSVSAAVQKNKEHHTRR